MSSSNNSFNFPPKIRESLPDAECPWMLSKPVFSRVTASKGDGYKKSELYQTDREAIFVQRLFEAHKPTNRSIGHLYCIHNAATTKQFEASIVSIEAEADPKTRAPVFAPHWQEEDNKDLREKVIDRWHQFTGNFSPFAIHSHDGRQTKKFYEYAKVLPVFHGTTQKVCESICKTGFTFFGKHENNGASGSPKSTDEGYYGSGIYFSTSARYAAEVYSDGNLLCAWVSMREPYPVVADAVCKPPQEPSDLKKLKKLGAYQAYNAHFIPAVNVAPGIYYPCARGQSPELDELVVFNKGQTFAQFWIVLQVDLTKGLSSETAHIGATISTFLEKITKLLDSSKVEEDKELCGLLESEFGKIVELDGAAPIPAQEIKFFNLISALLTEAGAVRSVTAKMLKQMQNSPKDAFESKTIIATPYKAKDESKHEEEDARPKSANNLIEAVALGDVKRVQFFLSTNSKLSEFDSAGCTALMRASQKGFLDIAALLIASKAEVDQGDSRGKTALVYAARMGQTDVVDLLIQHGANVNHESIDYGITALMYAAEACHELVVTRLMNAGAKVLHKNKYGATPLMYASTGGSCKIVERLILARANVSEMDKWGKTALHSAASSARNDVIKVLVNHRADINALTEIGASPLSEATERQHLSTVELLCSLHASMGLYGTKEYYPLVVAAKIGSIPLIQTLLQYKAQLNNASHKTPLMTASEEGHFDVVKFLVENKADVNIKLLAGAGAGKDGTTALHMASENGHRQVVEFLLNCRADINAKSIHIFGMGTSLMKAAEAGKKEIVELLIERRADVNYEKITTAEELARRNGHKDIAQLLHDKGGCVIQ